MLRLDVRLFEPGPACIALALACAAACALPAGAQEEPGTGAGRLGGAEIAWEAALERPPEGPPVAAQIAGGSVILLGDREGVEARDPEDGARAWRLDGARTDRLGISAPDASGRAVGGWSGIGLDGSPRLVLVDLATGSVSASHPLPRPPTGAPLRITEGGADAWLVPLDEGQVAVVPVPSGDISILTAPAPVRPPLLSGPDRPLVVSGSPPALRDLVRRPHRELATGLAPQTVAASRGWIYGALGRTLCGHSCRVSRRGRLRCSRRWCQELGAEMVAPPLVVPGLVIAGARDTFAYAFREESGHLAWRTRVGQRIEHTPLAWRGAALVVPVAGRRIAAVDVRDGTIAGHIDAGPGETFRGGGALVGDRLVVLVERLPDVSVLRAYALPAPGPGDAQPDEDAAASTSSPRSAARNLSSSMR